MTAQRGDFARPPVDRTGADDATLQAMLDRIESAPAAEEGAVEVVARAMHYAVEYEPWDADTFPGATSMYRRMARAAIAALKPAPGTDSSGRASCGHLSPALVGERFMCELPHGHGGTHQRDNGDGLPPMWWIEADSSGLAVQRVLDLAERANRHGYDLDPDDVLTAVAGPQRDHGEG